MKIGMNMLLWTVEMADEHLALFPSLKEAGYDGVEFMITDAGAAHWTKVRSALDDAGLECTAVLGLDEDTNPASPDAAIREAAVDRIKAAVDACGIVGSKMLCGPFHSAYKVFTLLPPTDAECDHAASVLRAGAEATEGSGVKLSIEALNRFECYLVNTAAQARDLVDRAAHPSVGYHYDTHHAHIEESSSGDAIRASAKHITHVHISENDRGVPGRGQVDWDGNFSALKAIGYDDWLVIESFSREDPDFAGAIHIWRDYCAHTDEVWRDGIAFVRDRWANA